jgi:predicted PurR-regulated permease PerM
MSDNPVGFQLTDRERRWLDAVLVLAAVTLGFIVLGYVGQVFATFADLIFIFFLAWLLAFILSPAVSRLRTAVPFLSRAGAVIVVYLVLFSVTVTLSLTVAAALVGSIGQLIASVPSLRENLPGILAPWQGRIDGLGLFRVDLVAQANTVLDNLNE